MFFIKYNKRLVLIVVFFVVAFVIWYQIASVMGKLESAPTSSKNSAITTVTPTVLKETKYIRDISICNVSHLKYYAFYIIPPVLLIFLNSFHNILFQVALPKLRSLFIGLSMHR